MSSIEIIHDNSYRATQAIELGKSLEKKDLLRKVIITIGREVVDQAIAAKQEGDILVSVLDPGKNYDAFDLIFVPKHDPHPKLPNIKTTTGLINQVTPKLVQEHAGKYNSKRQMVTLLIGGRHVGGNFSVNDAAKLANIINMSDSDVLVSTSHRTEAKATAALKKELWKTQEFFDFNKDGLAANPYFPMLAAADKVIVTADSVRMCSEACSSGKKVFIFTPEKLHFSYASLRDSLIKSGAAYDIGSLQTNKPTITLNESERAALQVVEYIAKKS